MTKRYFCVQSLSDSINNAMVLYASILNIFMELS